MCSICLLLFYWGKLDMIPVLLHLLTFLEQAFLGTSETDSQAFLRGLAAKMYTHQRYVLSPTMVEGHPAYHDFDGTWDFGIPSWSQINIDKPAWLKIIHFAGQPSSEASPTLLSSNKISSRQIVWPPNTKYPRVILHTYSTSMKSCMSLEPAKLRVCYSCYSASKI